MHITHVGFVCISYPSHFSWGVFWGLFFFPFCCFFGGAFCTIIYWDHHAC